MKRQIALLVAGALLAMATAASAGNKAETFSVSPVIGGYTYDNRQHIDTNAVFGARAGYNFTKAIGIEALFDYANPKQTSPSANVRMYRYGGELLYHFMPDKQLVPYVAAGFAGLNFDGGGVNKSTHGAFDYGAGLKYFLVDNFALRGDVRHIITPYNNTAYNNVEYTLGAYIPFGGATPAAKPVETPVQEQPKAVELPPAAPAPSVSLSANPGTVKKGESTVLSWTSENATACDIQPGIGPVQPKGSIKATPAEDASYTITCNGAGGSAKSSANVAVTVPAPVAPPAVEAAQPKASAAAQRFCNKPAMLAIAFDTNKSDIKPKYYNELKTVGDFLKEFPNARGEISGHTDNVGGKEFNNKLSQRRADSVKKYIVEKFGIAADRITTKGYGFSKPVASNKTKAGKAQNRRIEANFNCD